MRHLEASRKGQNQLWRYVIMIALAIGANALGSLPVMVCYVKARMNDPAVAMEFIRSYDFTLLGINEIAGLGFLIFPFVVMFFIFVWFIRTVHERTFLDTVNGGVNFRVDRFFYGALIWIALSVLYLGVFLIFDPENFKINNLSVSLVTLVIVITILIPFQAGYEELFMRGYLMQGFYNIIPRKYFPLLITSLIFGLLHTSNPEVRAYGFVNMMPQYFLIGLIFGITTILDDGIEIAMGAHSANNIFLSVMLTHESSALRTPAMFEQVNIYPWLDFAGMLIMSLLFIFILGRKYRWDLHSLLN